MKHYGEFISSGTVFCPDKREQEKKKIERLHNEVDVYKLYDVPEESTAEEKAEIIFNGINKNKKIYNAENYLGLEYGKLKGHLNSISDVYFFFRRLLKFLPETSVANDIIYSYYELFVDEIEHSTSPFKSCRSIETKNELGDILINYAPSDSLVTLCFAIWHLWLASIFIVNKQVNITDIDELFSKESREEFAKDMTDELETQKK